MSKKSGLIFLGLAFCFLLSLSLTSAAGVAEGREAWKGLGSAGTVLSYIFGPAPTGGQFATMEIVSVLIIVVSVWLLIVVTFGDIISSFSTFSKGVSWTAAFLIGVIAANIGLSVKIISVATSWFASLGTIAVFVGLGAAFLAFLAVNLGITSLSGWMMRRRLMMEADKTFSEAQSGGKKAAGALAALGEINKVLISK